MDAKKNEIAYLIQAYADSKALKELITILLNMQNCHIFVHLDKKSNLLDFYVKDDRVHYIEKREFVSWAGYKQGKLIFNLIEAAIEYPIKFDRYCFLSESDFPVYNGECLLEKIDEAKPIFINCSILQKEKIERYWFYDFGVKSAKLNKIISKLINGIFGCLYKMKIFKKPNKVMLNNKQVDIYCSGPFWCYNYEQLEYIDKVYKKNKSFRKYFKSSFAACELMVSTIIGNSKYKDMCKIVDEYINLNEISSLCYFKYTGPRVNVLTIDDYLDIMNSKKPFIRKVKMGMSDELINKMKDGWH